MVVAVALDLAVALALADVAVVVDVAVAALVTLLLLLNATKINRSVLCLICHLFVLSFVGALTVFLSLLQPLCCCCCCCCCCRCCCCLFFLIVNLRQQPFQLNYNSSAYKDAVSQKYNNSTDH